MSAIEIPTEAFDVIMFELFGSLHAFHRLGELRWRDPFGKPDEYTPLIRLEAFLSTENRQRK
jgi:hypothetical protein